MIKGLPEKLRDLRKKYSYSQKQVADRLGSSHSIMSGYETGERTPSTENLLALAYLYNCSTDYLLGKQSPEPKAGLVIDIAGLSVKQVKAINTLVDAMKEK